MNNLDIIVEQIKLLSSTEDSNLLDKYANDKNVSVWVKKYIAKNKFCNSNTLYELSFSNCEDVRLQVALNKNTNEKTLRLLSEDQNDNVSETAFYRLEDFELSIDI